MSNAPVIWNPRNPWGKPGVFTSFSLDLGSPVVGEYTFFQGFAVQYGDWAGVWRGFNSWFATFFRGLGSSCESSHDAMSRKIKPSSTEPEKTEKLVFCQIFILLGLANNVIVSNRKNIQSNAIWGCKTITNYSKKVQRILFSNVAWKSFITIVSK